MLPYSSKEISASDKRDKNFYLTILSIAKFLLEQRRLQTYEIWTWINDGMNTTGEKWSTRWKIKNSVKNEVIGEEWSNLWRMKY